MRRNQTSWVVLGGIAVLLNATALNDVAFAQPAQPPKTDAAAKPKVGSPTAPPGAPTPQMTKTLNHHLPIVQIDPNSSSKPKLKP